MLLNRVCLILCSILVWSSCKKEDVGDFLNISITPPGQYEIRNSGEIIHFSIKLSSNSALSELIIVEEVNNSIIDTIYHEQISGLEKTELYTYTCPNLTSSDTSEVKLIFYCSNTNGDITERAKVFSVVSETILLEETTIGGTMYSSNSSEFNSFDLLTGLPMYSSPDSTSHISDNTDSLSDILSRKWVSMSGVLFTEVPQFNYAHATLEGIENAYSTNQVKPFVDNIEADNIIIAKIENNYVLIKITQVIDDVGSDNDRYIFNIKQ
jgi:hypothetical protein